MTAPHHAVLNADTPVPKLALAPTSSITGFGGGLSKVTLLELAGASPASRTPDSAMPSDGGFLTPVSASAQNHSNDHFEVPDFSMTRSGSSFTSTTRTRRTSRSRTSSRRTGSSVSRDVSVHSVRVVNLTHGHDHDDRGSEAAGYPPDDLTDDELDYDSMVEEYVEPEIVIPAYVPPPVIPKSSLRKIQREDKKKNGQKTKSKKFWKRKLCVIQ